MPRRSIDIGGARLDAVVEGAGPVTVVFENGLATALESWDAVAPVLAERARTVRYDRRRATHAGDRLGARTAPRHGGRPAERCWRRWLSARPMCSSATAGAGWSRVRSSMPSGGCRRPRPRRRHARSDRLPWVRAAPGDVHADGRRGPLRGGAALAARPDLPAGRPARLPGAHGAADRQPGAVGRWPAHRAVRRRRHSTVPGGAGPRLSDLPPVPVHVLTAGGVTGPNLKQVRRVHEPGKRWWLARRRREYTNVPGSGHQMPIEVPEVVSTAIGGVLDRDRAASAQVVIRGPRLLWWLVPAHPFLRAISDTIGLTDSRPLAQSIIPRLTFDDVVLPEATRRALEHAMTQVRRHDLIFRQWGLGERYATGQALVFNFAGPSGTGKTICAEAIAHALGRRLLMVRYAEVESMWMGETPKNVAELFRTAGEENAVLFFDEADSIAARRSTVAGPGLDARVERGGERAAEGTGVVSRRRDLRHQSRGELRSRVRAADSHAGAVRDAERRRPRAALARADASPSHAPSRGRGLPAPRRALRGDRRRHSQRGAEGRDGRGAGAGRRRLAHASARPISRQASGRCWPANG